MPNFILKYHLNENTLFRFAWSHTIIKPNYIDLAPTRRIYQDDQILIEGNPELKPATSVNVDFRGEKYFKTVGQFSVGLYYKTIDDFIFDYVYDIPLCHFEGVTSIEFWNSDDPANVAAGKYRYNMNPKFDCKDNKIIIFYNTSRWDVSYDLNKDHKAVIKAFRKINQQKLKAYLDIVLIHEIGHNYDNCVLNNWHNTNTTTAEKEYFANTFKLKEKCENVK